HHSSRPDSTSQTPEGGQLSSVATGPLFSRRRHPARAAEHDALSDALAGALSALEPQQRICWILRELHGLRYAQIAHVTGTTEQTVRGRLFRARRTLKEALGTWR
ncbi:RNA polymerase sigma factor, partial [Streptomyces sp. NPDC088733]|uniref:RNA polymerase sigma factor n=1 Tax=Streptomyces sp. NPDC088733 TaxID=3365880 RepID=UPI00382191D7